MTPPNTSGPTPLRIVKIGSEGIAIKPDTGDLKTDIQTVAMCGLNEPLARMFAAAPDMLAALKELVRVVGGTLQGYGILEAPMKAVELAIQKAEATQ